MIPSLTLKDNLFIAVPKSVKRCEHCRKSVLNTVCLRIDTSGKYMYIHLDCVDEFFRFVQDKREERKEEIEQMYMKLVAEKI